MCHPSCSSLTQRQGVGLKKPEAEPRVGGEVGPCPGSGAGQGTLLLQAQGLLPFPQVGTEGHLLPAAALLGCSCQPTKQFTAASQYGRHKGKGTFRRSHQRTRLGLLLTHNLPNSLLFLHSCRLPSQQGHQMSPLPRSFRVISTSLPPEVRAVHDGELSVIRTPGLAVS